jgi:HKD family nuclease
LILKNKDIINIIDSYHDKYNLLKIKNENIELNLKLSKQSINTIFNKINDSFNDQFENEESVDENNILSPINQ